MVCVREAETIEVDQDAVREFETSASVGTVDSVSDEPVVDEEVAPLLVVMMLLLFLRALLGEDCITGFLTQRFSPAAS